ncbi:MAG: efflux RND transporter periplasmic adaptor subunit [Arachidicoccus sp.]|nr:efflux RND transporter periplasmic adaptor subunit [Arachidicoccus sp.]
MIRRILLVLVVVLLLGAIVFRLASNKKNIDKKNAVQPVTNIEIPVNTYMVSKSDYNDSLIKIGSLIPFKEADINAVAGGQLISVHFNLGTMVSEGETVADIDNKQLHLNLQQALLNKNKAEKDVKRSDTLYAGNATTLQDVQNTKLNYDNTVNQIQIINKQIEDSHIKAPISGQIVSKFKEAGEYVAIGAALGHIVDLSRLKADVSVNEADVYSLKNGQEVKVSTDIYPNTYFTGHISFISNKGDAAHNYQVEITLQNSAAHPLKAGTFAYVNFERKSSDKAILIPRSSLLEGMQSPKVYIVENGKSVLKNIVTGKEAGDMIEVRDGLKEGDKVITNGQINLKEGTTVREIIDSTDKK